MAVACYRNPLDRTERIVLIEGPVPKWLAFAGEPQLWDWVDIQLRGDEVPEYQAAPPPASAELLPADLADFTRRLRECGFDHATEADVRAVIDRLRDQELAMGLMHGFPIGDPA